MALVSYKSTNSQDYVVGSTIGMGIGYRISGGVISAPRPTMQTLRKLDGTTSTWSNSATNVIIASIDCPNNFVTIPNGEGTIYTITINNIGLADLTVETPIFSNIITEANPVFSGGLYSAPPWTISSGSNAKFGLSYSTRDYGIFNEAIVFRTNEAGRFQRKDIVVSSSDGYSMDVGVAKTFETTLVKPNENYIGTFTITLLKNDKRIEGDPQITASLQGNPTWSIERIDPYVQEVSSATVTVRFNPNLYNLNTALPYVSTLTISSAIPYIQSKQQTVSMIYNPDLTKNYSSTTWMSTLTQPDVIVGARIDYVQSGTQAERVLTLGVGSGADGSPKLKDGADSQLMMNSLNPWYGPDRGIVGHEFWQTVYSFRLTPTPIQGTATLFQSKNHKIKSQGPGLDYDQYFGNFANSGTMFTVQLEDTGIVRIYWNDLRETTNGVDTALDQTLGRLTRSFYYYSIADSNQLSRSTGTFMLPVLGVTVFYQQVFENGVLQPTFRLNEFGTATQPIDIMTKYFVGFDNSNTIITSLVPSPN